MAAGGTIGVTGINGVAGNPRESSRAKSAPRVPIVEASGSAARGIDHSTSRVAPHRAPVAIAAAAPNLSVGAHDRAAITKPFNVIITALQGPITAGRVERRLEAPEGILYRWLYRRPAIFRKNPLRPHGFYLRQGATIALTIDTQRTNTGWERRVEVTMAQRPGGLGAHGPIPFSRGGPPLGEMRVAKMVFYQTFNESGRVTGEKTEVGVTFADPQTGELVGPPAALRFLDHRKRSYEGTTLYLIDMTDITDEIWAKDGKRLTKTLELHRRETGENLQPQSAAHRLAYLKYVMLVGFRNAGPEGRHRAKAERARAALPPNP
jgi:hypothetical protein